MSHYNYDDQGSLMNVEEDVCQQVSRRRIAVGGRGGQGSTRDTGLLTMMCYIDMVISFNDES